MNPAGPQLDGVALLRGDRVNPPPGTLARLRGGGPGASALGHQTEDGRRIMVRV